MNSKERNFYFIIPKMFVQFTKKRRQKTKCQQRTCQEMYGKYVRTCLFGVQNVLRNVANSVGSVEYTVRMVGF